MLTSDGTDFRIKEVTGDKDRRVIGTKGTVQQDDTTLTDMYAPNQGGPKYTWAVQKESSQKCL